MNFNIQKLQQGGELSAPWVGYTPFFQQIGADPTTSAQANASAKGGDTKIDATQKQIQDVIGSMAGKGLNNEVNYFAQQVGDLFSDSQLTGQPMTLRQYTNLVARLNEIQNNKQMYDEARKIALDKGTLSEAAITFDGNLYAQDKSGKMVVVNPMDYAENKDQYHLLTNNDLLTLRNNSKAFLFDKTLSQTVAGSLSINDINKEIDTAIKMIQKEDTSSDLYINKARANEFNNELQKLINTKLGTAPDDNLYKMTTEVSTQRNHLNTALIRIWNKLPQHAKNTLTAQAAINESGNPRENALNALADLLTYGTYHSEKQSIKDEGALDGSGRKSSSGSAGLTELGPFEIYAGAAKTKDYTVGLGGKYSLSTKANISPLVGADKKLLNNNYMSDIISTGGLGALVDPNGASLGTRETLSDIDLSKILYSNDQVATAWMPFIRNANGSKVVDLDALNRLSLADEEIKQLNNPSEEAKKKIYDKHNVSHLILTGDLPTSQQLEFMTQFMVIPSYVPDSVVEKTSAESFLQALPKREREDVQELYAKVRASGSNKDTRTSSFAPDTTWIPFFPDEAIYKTSLFLPMSDDIIMRSIVGGNSPLVTKDRLEFMNMARNQSSLDNPTRLDLSDRFGLNK